MLSASRLFSSFKVKTAAILHLTDMEGSNAFFKAIKQSHILHYEEQTGLAFNRKYHHPYFIYGGDVTDRGNNDLEITRLLVNFKKKYPENVFLIAGNREITKNRFKIELDARFIHARLLQGKSPRWLTPDQQSRPIDYVVAEMKAQGHANVQDQQAVQAYVHSLSVEQAQIIYLHWMLEKTMGCPHTFRYRREELAKTSLDVTDADVLKSFIKESSPTGITGEYLKLAQMGVVIPDTGVMAIHGGLTPYNIGRLPEMKPEEASISDLPVWIKKYNDWFSRQIEAWTNLNVTGLTEPAFTAIDDCSLPLLDKPKSIMVADMLDKDKQFAPVAASVTDYIANNHIHVVLTGHQACGDHPAIVRAGNSLFIDGDTGYAVADAKNPDDTRGATGHTLEILASKTSAEITIQATLSDNTPVMTQLIVTADKIQGDPHIGNIIENNRLIQCRLPDGNYRLAYLKGRNASYSTASQFDIKEKTGSGPTMLF